MSYVPIPRRCFVVVLCCLGALGLASPCWSQEALTPRVLLVGDSWSAVPQAFGTFQTVFPEYPGLEHVRSLGFRSAVVAMRTHEFLEPTMMGIVAEELALYPTIDIVHMSLGGNDLLYGAWNAGMTYEQEQTLFESWVANIETGIDFILSQRPDIRIGLCGYTFAHHEKSGVSIQRMNEALAHLEAVKRDLALGKDRVFYIHNLGLMQYHFGIPDADPPILPGTVPYPGGYPDYDPMPGGDITNYAPLEALVDNDIHLTAEGYAIVARRCIDEFYGEWLSWPRALEVMRAVGKTNIHAFQVRFSEAVTGVDVSDFEVTPAEAAILDVSGSGAVYTVTVSYAGSGADLHLSVLDDDTIIDVDSNPLGGIGLGNGLFTYNGSTAYTDPAPPEAHDFDQALQFLDVATAPYTPLLGEFSFLPSVCDANGGFTSLTPLVIAGNGMLDSCELALIRACLNNPSLNLSATGGVTHAITAQAWARNLAQMRQDLGGEGSLALLVLRGIDSVLAGFMVLGDQISSMLPVLLVIAAGSFDEFPLDLHTPELSSYTLLPQYFSYYGDADGDGYTNQQEYDYFMSRGGRDLYVMAALDPYIKPGFTCDNSLGGTFNEGSDLCLIVPDPVNLGGGFQWLKNGLPLADDDRIQGCMWREFSIAGLVESDTGAYSCEYEDGTKAPALFGPITVTVVKVVLPVSNWTSLACVMALLAACGAALAGRGAIRRASRSV